MVSHLGMNPVSGGKPARDRSKIGKISCIVGDCIITFLIVVLDLIDFKWNVMKIGVMISAYIKKYDEVSIGLKIDRSLVIHPIWVIDEYAIIDRNLVWLRPINPPINAFADAITVIIYDEEYERIKDKIIRGASFCHVDRIKQDGHDADAITDGYHKWHGTMPNFRVIDMINRNNIILPGIDLLNHKDILDINIILEPSAWARKYLIAASVSWNFFEFIRIGINLRRFNSIAAHRNNQLEDITVIIVLNTMTEDVRMRNGGNVNDIKIWWSWTT